MNTGLGLYILGSVILSVGSQYPSVTGTPILGSDDRGDVVDDVHGIP